MACALKHLGSAALGDPAVGVAPLAAGGPSALVTAVIIPGDLDAVLDVLDRRGSRAFHVSEAQGRPGPGAGATEIYKGAVYRSRTAARVRLEVVTPGTDACALMDEIAAACGLLSEGDIFAVDLLSRPRAGCARSNGAGRAEADPPQP